VSASFRPNYMKKTFIKSQSIRTYLSKFNCYFLKVSSWFAYRCSAGSHSTEYHFLNIILVIINAFQGNAFWLKIFLLIVNLLHVALLNDIPVLVFLLNVILNNIIHLNVIFLILILINVRLLKWHYVECQTPK
jgi:hypothetical protein